MLQIGLFSFIKDSVNILYACLEIKGFLRILNALFSLTIKSLILIILFAEKFVILLDIFYNSTKCVRVLETSLLLPMLEVIFSILFPIVFSVISTGRGMYGTSMV